MTLSPRNGKKKKLAAGKYKGFTRIDGQLSIINIQLEYTKKFNKFILQTTKFHVICDIIIIYIHNIVIEYIHQSEWARGE